MLISLFSQYHFSLHLSQLSLFGSLTIPSLDLPVRFFSVTLPSITLLNNPVPLNTCPIQFFFRCLISQISSFIRPCLATTSSVLIYLFSLSFSVFSAATHASSA